jgi:hypothetical protein
VKATKIGAEGPDLKRAGFRIASITVWKPALESRITSGDERLKAVSVRIWLKMTAGATFASTIWMMWSLVRSDRGRYGGTGAADCDGG